MRRVIVAIVALALTSLMACEGPAGPPGTPGDGGGTGDPGGPGEPGGPGRSPYLTGPGLIVELIEATITAGTATATVKITDAAGVPLDRDGRYTAGAVSMSFVLAHLGVDADGDPGQYTAYTTNAAGQAAGQSNGAWAEIGVAQGTYRYTFAAPFTVADATRTHTVGVYGNRTFADVRHGDDDTFDFVPSGAAVTMRRDVVPDAACAQCHDTFAFHGGARKSIALCVTCHTGQSTDPDTGNTVDFKVMVHKIHRGADLASVAAGVPYRFVGFGGAVYDYSTVGYPHALADCQTCHRAPATDAGHWSSKPSVAACTSCHDQLTFEVPTQPWQTRHIGQIQPNDDCSLCHGATSGVEPIVTRHRVPELDPMRVEPVITVTSVTNSGPGQTPTVAFTVEAPAGTPRNIRTSPLPSVRATFAGPNTDYARYWQATIQGAGAAGVLTDVDPAAGRFTWTVPATAAIPVDATGSFTVGFEYYLQYTDPDPNRPPCPPTSKTSCRLAGAPPRFPFAVTGAVAPRRTVVEAALCNNCHVQLSFHGGGREDANYCVMCHNANNVNEERISRLEGAANQPYVHSVHLKKMIHGIHMGDQLTQAYVLGTFPAPSVSNPVGAPHDFAETRYPSNAANCKNCHVGTTYRLPLNLPGLLPTFDQVFRCDEDPALDTDDLCEPFSAATPLTNLFRPIETIVYRPEAAACMGCHDAPFAMAHAQVMTTMAGAESCATCHGPGAQYDVDRVHGLQ